MKDPTCYFEELWLYSEGRLEEGVMIKYMMENFHLVWWKEVQMPMCGLIHMTTGPQPQHVKSSIMFLY